MIIFFFFFFLGFVVLLHQKKSILMVLLYFEFLFLIVFVVMVGGGTLHGVPHNIMIIIIFAVAEAAVGLGLLVGLVHVSGSESVGVILQVF